MVSVDPSFMPDPDRDVATTLLADCVGTLKQRGNEYGKVTEDFERIASLWNMLHPDGRFYKPHDVAMYMICLKLSRLTWGPGNRDSWLDIAGYAALGWACAVAEEKKRIK